MPWFIKKIILAVILLSCFQSNAQTDTEFWFVAPDLQVLHGDSPVFLRFSSFADPATITVSQPANPAFPVQQININANSLRSLDLTPWLSLIENQPYNTVLNKGILIRSTAKISCYYDILNGFNGDIYALKGNNALGTKFTVPMQQFFQGRGTPDYLATIEIVATADNTSITITPAKDLVGHAEDFPFTITLNRGETYSLAAESNDPLLRPGGTVITSDKPIAVTTKDDSIKYPGFGCFDTVGDQLIPDYLAGTEFVIVSGYLSAPDYFFVFATEDGTDIKVNGSIVASINAGEYYTGTLAAQACFVETTKPSHIFHVSGFGCEMGGAIIPSVKCTGSRSVSLARASDHNFYVNIFTTPAAVTGFTLNGSSNIITSAQFQPVPGSGGTLVYAKLFLTTQQVPTGSVAKIDNSLGKFHVGLIHGDQTSTCRYGFFSEFSNSAQIVSTNSGYCRGSTFSINAISPGATSFSWTGPNSFTASGPTLTLNNFQPSQQGYYKVIAQGSPCGTATDSVFIKIKVLTTIENITLCEGGSYQGYNTSGTYIDSFLAIGGCDSIRTLNLTVNTITRSVTNKTICYGQNFAGYNISGTYIDTVMGSNGCDSISTLRLVVKPPVNNFITASVCPNQSYLGYSIAGTYIDTLVATDACVSIRTLKLVTLDKCEVYFPSGFTPNNDGRNDIFRPITNFILPDYRIRIYNRWGQLVFESTDPLKGWNGKFNGEKLSTAVFAWHAEYRIPGETSLRYTKGLITLISN